MNHASTRSLSGGRRGAARRGSILLRLFLALLIFLVALPFLVFGACTAAVMTGPAFPITFIGLLLAGILFLLFSIGGLFNE